MRAGRVTVSHFKNACCTDPASPALSLVMSICHPDTLKFKTAELMGRFFSRSPPESTPIPVPRSTTPLTTVNNTCDSAAQNDDSKYFYCQGTKNGDEMVGCDNSE